MNYTTNIYHLTAEYDGKKFYRMWCIEIHDTGVYYNEDFYSTLTRAEDHLFKDFDDEAREFFETEEILWQTEVELEEEIDVEDDYDPYSRYGVSRNDF